MTEFRKPIATLCQAWTVWLVVLAMVLAWIGGGTPSRAISVAANNAETLAPAMERNDVATLSASWTAQRLSELRQGDDPDDIGLPTDAVQMPQGLGIAGKPREAPQHLPALAVGLPQPRAPPPT